MNTSPTRKRVILRAAKNEGFARGIKQGKRLNLPRDWYNPFPHRLALGDSLKRVATAARATAARAPAAPKLAQIDEHPAFRG